MSERSAADWGEVAVRLHGWRWRRGMTTTSGATAMSDDLSGVVEWHRAGVNDWVWAAADEGEGPDVDDPATGWAMCGLLGPGWTITPLDGGYTVHKRCVPGEPGIWLGRGPDIGRAAVAAAEAAGGWSP